MGAINVAFNFHKILDGIYHIFETFFDCATKNSSPAIPIFLPITEIRNIPLYEKVDDKKQLYI